MLWSAGNKKKSSWQFYWLTWSAADDKRQAGPWPCAARQGPEFYKQSKVQPRSLSHKNCQVIGTSGKLGGWSGSRAQLVGAGRDLQTLLNQFLVDLGRLRPRLPKGTWDPDLLHAPPVSLPCQFPFFIGHPPRSPATVTFPPHVCPALQHLQGQPTASPQKVLPGWASLQRTLS